MLLCDYRMIEGSPLRYTYDYHRDCDNSQEFQEDSKSQLFRPYLEEVHHTADYYPFSTYFSAMSEDMIVLPSPNSPQLSDSEGSISSTSTDSPKQKSLKCCWRNCGINFETLDQLATHVGKVHGASGPAGLFYCGWEGCTRNDRAFNARYKMLVHVRTHTNEKPHQCYQCDKSFSRAENLKIHIRSHSGEKPYVCPVPGCNKAYSNSSDRFKHTRTHQDDKPYPCKVPGCSKRYTDPSSLRKHVKTYKHYTSTNCDENQINCINSVNVKSKNAKNKNKMATNHETIAHAPSDENTNSFSGNEFEFNNYKENYNWSGLIGKAHFGGYEMDIDVDTPLDLSITRKS